MKKTLFLFLALALAATAASQTYQLPNAGFESWDNTALDAEPSYWNSFASSDGSFAGLASSPHHYHRLGGRPGTVGGSYLTIYSTSILGIVANGNMTNGRIHAGGLSASSDKNYNYTQRSNASHSLPFTATPDSLYVWVSYYAADAASQASITATLHGDNDFRDPNDGGSTSLYAARAQAAFPRTTSSASQPQWTLVKVSFVYNGSASPAYMLISMTTNATPGGGSANDSLSIDDIQLVYSSWLADIALNGTSLPDFRKDRFDYTFSRDQWSVETLRSALTYTAEVSDATVALTTVGDTLLLTVTAEDGVTQHRYRLIVRTGDDPVAIAPVVPGPAFRLYPNPAHEAVTVTLADDDLLAASPATLTLTDLQGRLYWRQHLASGRHQLSLAGLPAGHYLVTLTTPDGTTAQPLLVQ